MPPERTQRGWGYARRVSRTDPQEAVADDSTGRLSPTTAFCSRKSFGVRGLGAISDSSSGSSSVGRIWIEIDEAIEAARARIARAQDEALGAAEVTPMPARAEGPSTSPGVLPGVTARGGFEYPAIPSVPPSRLETPSPGKRASMQKVRDFQNLVERLQHARLSTTGSGSVDNPSRKNGAGARKQVDISEESNLTSASLLSKRSLLTAVSIPTPRASVDEGACQAAGGGKKDHAAIKDASTEVAKPKKAKGFNPAAAVFAPAKENAPSPAARMGGSDHVRQTAGQPAVPDAFLNGAPIPGGGIPPGPLIAIIPPPIIQTPQGQLLPTSPFGVALPLNSNVMQTDLSALVAMQQLVVQQTALQAQLAVAGGGMLPMLGQRPPPVVGPPLPPRSGSPAKAAFKPSGPSLGRPRPMPTPMPVSMPVSMPLGIHSCPAAPRPPQAPLAPEPAPRPVVNRDLLKFDARGRLVDVRKPRGHNSPLLQLQYEAAIEWKKANVPGYAEECRRRQNERNERNTLRNLHQHLQQQRQRQQQQHFAQGPHSANMPGRTRGDDMV